MKIDFKEATKLDKRDKAWADAGVLNGLEIIVKSEGDSFTDSTIGLLEKTIEIFNELGKKAGLRIIHRRLQNDELYWLRDETMC